MQDRQFMLNHLQHFGMVRNYIHWVMHGEYEFRDSIDTINVSENQQDDDMHGLLHDAFGVSNNSDILEQNNTSHIDLDFEQPNEEAKKFNKLLGDGKRELYFSCTKFTKLSFVIRLIHIKCLNG